MLVERSGMSARHFDRIAVLLDWSHVEVADVDKFCGACEFPIIGDSSPERRFFDRQMAQAAPFAYLGHERRAKFERLCIRWQAREAILSDALAR